MHQEFWLERWQENQIGFHNEEINRHLQTYWPTFNLKPGSKVFVPLCGKSIDMLWLLSKGYEVIAVEISPIAVQAFLSENGLVATTSQVGKFTVSSADDGLRIFCGDFFDLTADDLAGVSAVYDRAALVALPAEMRKAYVAHLHKILPAKTQILLVAFDYPQHEMSGPPFCVDLAEVMSLYLNWADVQMLLSEDIIDWEPQFRERGVNRIQEQIYAITTNG